MLNAIRQALSGRYIIERELGRGGMAVVYLARDLKHSRSVALKVIKQELSNTIGVERFLREIKTTAKLNHPNILPLFDSGEIGSVVFYTMPYVAGESLRSRLDREGHLPTPSAIQITKRVCDALAHAHAQGVIHRDIKPENILLGADEHVWVSDFGLARAYSSAANERVTGVGFAVGSPAYMSPEQAAGEKNVDHRSDIYSLGCVLFEMLAAEPPYRASSVASLLARHLSAPVPSIVERAPQVPLYMDAAMRRALAKERDDRFQSVREFSSAVDGHNVSVPPSAVRRPIRANRVRTAGIVLASLTLVFVLGKYIRLSEVPGLKSVFRTAVLLDTTRYAILPFDRESGVPVLHEEQLLHAAMGRWRDITLVDEFRVQDAVAQARQKKSNSARVTSRALGAGRFIRGKIVATGKDSLLLTAAVYDANDNDPAVIEAVARLPRNGTVADSAFYALAAKLLFADASSSAGNVSGPATNSRVALQAFASAQSAVAEWDLPRADSLYGLAISRDPQYAQALSGLSQVRAWQGRGSVEWRVSAERALASPPDKLGERERKLMRALLAMSDGEYPRACGIYTELLKADSHDFAAAFGLGDCQIKDRLVIQDKNSPSGWSYRSSAYRGVLSYKRAFELVPSTYRAFRAGRFRRLRTDFFLTGSVFKRDGLSAAGKSFRATPAWPGDTLIFVPYPIEDFSAAQPWTTDSTSETATLRLRQIFYQVTRAWSAAFPNSTDVLEAEALALDLLDEPSALESLVKARALSKSGSRQNERELNLGISEFWLRLKRGLPDNQGELSRAAALSDSLLSSKLMVEENTARRLSAIAAVTGRVQLAAQLARQGATADGNTTARAVSTDAAALLTFAAAGVASDSIKVLERRVEVGISNTMEPRERERARLLYLGRAAALAFPSAIMSSIGSPEARTDYLLQAEYAFSRKDMKAMKTWLDVPVAARTRSKPKDLQYEALFIESWLLYSAGDALASRNRLNPTLDVVRFVEPGALENVASAGTLARSAFLRAEVSARLNDKPDAKAWAAAVLTLWRRADPEFHAAISRAKALSR